MGVSFCSTSSWRPILFVLTIRENPESEEEQLVRSLYLNDEVLGSILAQHNPFIFATLICQWGLPQILYRARINPKAASTSSPDAAASSPSSPVSCVFYSFILFCKICLYSYLLHNNSKVKMLCMKNYQKNVRNNNIPSI